MLMRHLGRTRRILPLVGGGIGLAWAAAFLSFGLVAASGRLAAQAAGGAGSRAAATALRFDATRRDLGSVETGKSVATRFTVRNTGRRAVRLISIEGECGCLRVRGPAALAPGGTGAIQARFEPMPLWGGKVEKIITVRTDEPGHPDPQLVLTATVIPYIRIEPQHPVEIRYEPGGRYQVDLRLTPRAGRAVTISPPKGPPSRLVSARLTPPAASDRAGTYHLRLDVGPVRGPGDMTETLQLPTSEPHLGMLPVTLQILAARGPVASPREIYAPAIDAGQRETDLTKLQVFSRSGEFHLQAVDTGRAGLAARITEKTPGRAYEVTLHYTGGWRPGSVDTSLKLHTDDPSWPVIEVPFHVFVR
jgi:Protein of unknown function (DUF1573)